MAGTVKDNMTEPKLQTWMVDLWTLRRGTTTTDLGEVDTVESLAEAIGVDKAVISEWFDCQVNLGANKPNLPSEVSYVQRTLTVARQDTSAAHRRDLEAEYRALTADPRTAHIIDGVLTSPVDWDTISSLVCASVEPDGTRAVIDIAAPTATGWPDVLGGEADPFEVQRRILIEVRWAPWRDRRLRRLSKVATHAVLRVARKNLFD